LDAFHVLYEAPDPSKGLEMAMDTGARVAELEEKVRTQAQELAEYSAESEEIKNQDATIRRLEEKIRSLESDTRTKELNREQLRKEVAEELKEEADSKEAALKKLAAEANDKLEAMRSLHQQAQDQLLLMQSKSEELKVQYMAELEMAAAEIEKSHGKIKELEAEKQKAIPQKEVATADVSSPQAGANESLDYLRSRLEHERQTAASLREQVDAVLKAKSDFEAESGSNIENLKASLHEKDALVQSLQADLNDRPTLETVEELRRQLQVLQAVEYNAEPMGGDLPAVANSAEGLLR